jgi:hypothetical protein
MAGAEVQSIQQTTKESRKLLGGGGLQTRLVRGYGKASEPREELTEISESEKADLLSAYHLFLPPLPLK